MVCWNEEDLRKVVLYLLVKRILTIQFLQVLLLGCKLDCLDRNSTCWNESSMSPVKAQFDIRFKPCEFFIKYKPSNTISCEFT